MTTAFTWTLDGDAGGGVRRLVLRGVIDENAQLDAMGAALGKDNVLDLEGVERLNSMGVSGWIRFLRGAASSGNAVTLTKCSVAFVAQFASIADLTNGVHVASVMAPYACESCGARATRRIDLDGAASADDVDARVQQQVAAPFACPKCGKPMEFDDLPDHYFSFLRGRA
jgi:predicted RNA-binding Zn-ribbon protein involved in translation (DUF1610 family)/ABC-type transporter Mla MlaB component